MQQDALTCACVCGFARVCDIYHGVASMHGVCVSVCVRGGAVRGAPRLRSAAGSTADVLPYLH
jgi:hypothetical protein